MKKRRKLDIIEWIPFDFGELSVWDYLSKSRDKWTLRSSFLLFCFLNMVKKNPSGIALSQQRSTMGKNYTNPEITDRFIDGILGKLREGTEPPENPVRISSYAGGQYTLDRDWQVRGLNGEIMKYLIHPKKKAPRLRIHQHIRDSETWKIVNKEVEVNVLKLMEEKFWSYFPGYAKAITNPGEYMLVPADDDWQNLSWKNLIFVSKKEYNEQGTKRAIVKLFFQAFPDASDQELAEKTRVSCVHIRRVRKELEGSGRLEPKIPDQLKSLLGFDVTSLHVKIYKYFVTNGAEKSNLGIAREVFPGQAEQATTNAAKKLLTAPIVRIKKRLIEKGLLEENPLQKYREQVLELVKNKEDNHFTNQQIAEQFGLKKEQVDNLARTLKTKKRKNEE